MLTHYPICIAIKWMRKAYNREALINFLTAQIIQSAIPRLSPNVITKIITPSPRRWARRVMSSTRIISNHLTPLPKNRTTRSTRLNTRRRCVGTGRCTVPATMETNADTLTELRNLRKKLTLTNSTEPENASSITSKITVLMERDVTSSMRWDIMTKTIKDPVRWLTRTPWRLVFLSEKDLASSSR